MHGTAGSVRDRILLIAALLLTPIAAAADDALPEERLIENSEREILFSADLPIQVEGQLLGAGVPIHDRASNMASNRSRPRAILDRTVPSRTPSTVAISS